MSLCLGFDPIISAKPKVLILGTMPSVESLNQAFYYAHPRNAFWPIMSSIFDLPIDSDEDKTALIRQAGLVLWDVLAACERQGSLDSAIKNPQANDFEMLLEKYPSIKTICFNGKKAEQLFKRYVIKQQSIPDDIEYIVLSSTSPANAAITAEDKRLFWQEKISHLV
ncbi:MAG TPA: DNA-deoxyinosine glycosylase [Thiomicrospira sp.]|jgi:TDG/mug DNA glycosylase family protein|nr:DNA-deoxyinosine glycosylase [Thiomicrospira sp.]